MKSSTQRIYDIIHILRENTKNMPKPAVSVIIDTYGKDPFLILVTCLLSLRARDRATIPVAIELFKHVHNPSQLLALPLAQIEKVIYSIGYYHQKARLLHEVSRELLTRFDGKVPATEQELLSIKGVGRKTANLVLGVAYDIPSICVDIHVHRISNRLGIISTKTPEETEEALKKLLPKDYWVEYNFLLVMWGQNICLPVSPLCSRCEIYQKCDRVGVQRHR